MKALILVPVLAYATCGSAAAGDLCLDFTPTNSWNQAAAYKTDGAVPYLMSRKAQLLFALRRKALVQQADDGGTLSPGHREALQAELNAINSGHY